MPKPALIIEDDPDIAESVRYNLESEGFSAIVASNMVNKGWRWLSTRRTRPWSSFWT